VNCERKINGTMPDVKVFLSTTSGSPDWREAARRIIDSLPGFSSVVVESSLATRLPPHGLVSQRILEADVFVIILGDFVTRPVDRGLYMEAEQEYELAKRAGKPIVAMLSSELRDDARRAAQPLAERLYNEHVAPATAQESAERALYLFDSLESLAKYITSALLAIRDTPHANDFEISFDPELSDE
jgi:hypothetical protein